MISHRRLKELANYDASTGLFTWAVSRGGCVKQGQVCGSLANGYISIAIDGKRYRAHRLAWFYVYGKWPRLEIDHIDTNKSNNRISNLREASHAENNQNKRVATQVSSSGLLGAHLYKRTGKWQALIRVNGESKHLGYFDSSREAHEAYIAAKRVLHPFGML